MGTLLNRRRYMGGAKRLPYDAELEYLEGTGTQYINTGVLPTNETSWFIRIQRVDTSSTDEIPLGSRDNGGYTYDYTVWTNCGTNKGIAVHYAFNTGTSQREDSGWVYKGNITNDFHTVYVTPTTITVDGEVVYSWKNTERPTSQSTVPICLFNTKNGNNIDARYFKGRMSAASIWLSDVLVFDAIPVRVGTTGYMYDKVSGQLFGNAGTGDFVLGPDK